MLNQYITTYCVRYDPYVCDCDPESLWQQVYSAGGHISAKPMGIIDFFVPAHVISLVLLRDSALKIITAHCLI